MSADTPRPLRVPPTPFLKKLGYGTGVSVFEMTRSPKVGVSQSPWALKRVAKTQEKTTVYGRRLLSEADLLRQMSHPNIVGFRNFTKMSDGRSCLAMEKCEKSLGDMIEVRREEGLEPYPSNQILKMSLDIGNALDYIHTKVLILHSDVKSFNILVNGDFEICKLCDFGVSLPLNSDGVLDKNKTKEDYIGTHCWAAPEVLHLEEPITSKTDIFSFGITMWEMMSLNIPHTDIEDSCFSIDDSFASVEDKSLNTSAAYGTRPSIPDIDAAAYQDVLSLFFCTTEENPKARPAASEVVAFAKHVLSGS